MVSDGIGNFKKGEIKIPSLSLLRKLIFWYLYGSFASKCTTHSYGLNLAIQGAFTVPAAIDSTAEDLFCGYLLST